MTDGVSVVVPLHNEARSIGPLLDSLAGMVRPPDEIVLVDAGSTDETGRIAEERKAPCPVRVLRRGRLHPGEARNEGVDAARHEWIAFVDGGIRVSKEWLAELLEAARADGSELVFGSYEPVCDTRFKQSAAIAYLPAYRSWGGRGPFVASMLVRKAAYRKIGGFPSFRAAEDLIFIERAERSGLRRAHAPKAIVYWEFPGTLRSTFRRFSLYSFHNLVARRGSYWHWGVARQYLVVAGLTLASTLSASPKLALGIVPTWLVARAAVAARRKRRSFAFDTLSVPRIAGAIPILVTLDAATLVGALRWLRAGMPRGDEASARGRGGPDGDVAKA
jgi:glycosyltransferase involved in cell wall biosynthesis